MNKAREQAQEDRDDEYYAGFKANTESRVNRVAKRNFVGMTRNTRLPTVLLAASIEKIIMDMWNANVSIFFREPVDITKYPTYNSKVAQPMCLRDLREKAGMFTSHTHTSSYHLTHM